MNRRLAFAGSTALFGGIAVVAACNGNILDLGGNGDAGDSSVTPLDDATFNVQPDAFAPQGNTTSDAYAPPGSPTHPTSDVDAPYDDNFPTDAPATLDLPLVPRQDAGDPTASDQEVWLGYAENHTFPQSGSDVVKLTLTELGDGGVTGHVVLGSLPLFPPVTDPNVGYPYPDASADGLTGLDVTIVEGFAFTLYNGSLNPSNGRFQAGFDQREYQALWCTYQTPYAVGTNYYSCLPNGSGSGTTDECTVNLNVFGRTYPVNCNRWTFCGGLHICDCDGSACGSSVDPTEPSSKFDMQVNGSHADGSLTISVPFNPITVHLIKQ
jgi:hypothetical protein